MDEIQPYRDHAAAPAPNWIAAAPVHPHPHSHSTGAAPAPAAKVPTDYLKAVRRRIWLVLVVSIPLGVMTSIWALRQPSIYQARADIRIEPPELNPLLSQLVAREIGPRNPASQMQYVPDRIAQLKSTGLAELVVADPRVVNEMNQFADPARELLRCIQVRSNWPKNSWNEVSVENRDPVLAKKLLETLLDKFGRITDNESKQSVDEVKAHAETNLRNLKKEKLALDARIELELKENAQVIGPSGKNLHEEELVQHNSLLRQKEFQLGEVHQQVMMSQLFSKEMTVELDPMVQGRLAELERERKQLTGRLLEIKQTTRHFNSDPAAKYHKRLLQENFREFDALKSMPVKPAEQVANPTEMILDARQRELEADRATRADLIKKVGESMPGYQKYLGMLDDRDRLKEEIAKADSQLKAFDILALAQSQKKPVQDSGNGNVKEPTIPIRPNRAITIAMGLFLSLAAGIALVCALEHFDHRVKVPEHVTHGLTLPLLGVVPRMRRTALNHRAGHLWTPGTPDALEADAFRNVRASLLGVADRSGPIVTLLVTSAKAGEGKSTSALNLAATCAKAGERTLLLDVDLRRGSLGGVFGEEEDQDDDDPKRGLVDVLRGRLPWQCTVRRTPIPNLDFIPTGDTFDIPIEILGTRELRQLILALSHHYDRVILDGPAILGLADCLVLGRLVDSTMLVVRSGAHQLTTLYRAKGMLEQARVPIAGVVFNSLSEGLDSWSSYVTEQPAIASGDGPPGVGRGASGLAAPGRPDPRGEARDGEESFEFAETGAGR